MKFSWISFLVIWLRSLVLFNNRLTENRSLKLVLAKQNWYSLILKLCGFPHFYVLSSATYSRPEKKAARIKYIIYDQNYVCFFIRFLWVLLTPLLFDVVEKVHSTHRTRWKNTGRDWVRDVKQTNDKQSQYEKHFTRL